jgi:hypothetical protein
MCSCAGIAALDALAYCESQRAICVVVDIPGALDAICMRMTVAALS